MRSFTVFSCAYNSHLYTVCVRVCVYVFVLYTRIIFTYLYGGVGDSVDGGRNAVTYDTTFSVYKLRIAHIQNILRDFVLYLM